MSRKSGSAPAEVFVSHSSKNGRFAERLVKLLAAHGIQAFYSKQNIQGAQEWHDEIGRALNRCQWFLVILSPSSIPSVWVRRELVFALQQRRYEERIIPLMYRTAIPTSSLELFQRHSEWISHGTFKRVFGNCLQSGQWSR
jgi:hypothetical protein